MRNDEGTFARRHLVWAVIVLGREAGDFEGKISEGATSRARRDRDRIARVFHGSSRSQGLNESCTVSRGEIKTEHRPR